MRTFLLARHGQSQLNVAGIVNADPGRDPGLSPAGEEEARQLGRQIAALDQALRRLVAGVPGSFRLTAS